jgi:hypothetical protein
MSKMRKIAFIGIGAAVLLTILAVIFGYPPAVAGVHALPFFMLLIIDSSRDRKKANANSNQTNQAEQK